MEMEKQKIMNEDEIPLGKAKNLAGQRFGKLTALYRAANQGKSVMWKCRCDCGNEKNVRADSLVSGLTQSCGCLMRETSAQIGRKSAVDLTNMRFGRLVALYPTEERSSGCHVIWYCRCDCGNSILVSTDHLRSGNTQSCGCLKREKAMVDLTNMRFGRLTVLYPTEERSSEGSVVWHCLCDCGNTTLVSSKNLHSGNTQSCGCLVSHGEQKISELLNKHGIPYEPQKKFTSCRFSDTNAQAKFDFYISEDNYLIEYDGEQHFYVNGNWNTEENFQKTQEHDAYKNQWCKENNIPLIRIPYWHLNNLCIEDLLLETTQFRVI